MEASRTAYLDMIWCILLTKMLLVRTDIDNRSFWCAVLFDSKLATR